MATIQQNGSATTGTYYGGGSTKNNNGTAKNVGTLSTVLENSSLGRANVAVFGSTVIDGTDTDKALSGGVIAHNHVKPIAFKVTSELGGVSSSALNTTANDPSQVRLLHKRETYKVVRTATAIRAGHWNIYTGKWTVNPTSTTETPGTDNAASVTRSAPGRLVYKTGARLPVRDVYKAKTA
jgi:hypothetical protein